MSESAKERWVWVLADDPLVRAGLSALLDERGVLVVGQSALQGLSLESIEASDAEALILDWGFSAAAPSSPLNGLELPLIMLLASVEQAQQAVAWLDAERPHALLLRQSPIEHLIASLEAVLAGLLVLDPSLSAALSAPAPLLPAAAGVEALTARELEVLNLIAQGLPNKLIARQLQITDHTVKFHVNAIMGKLGAQSRTDAVVRATRLGWLTL